MKRFVPPPKAVIFDLDGTLADTFPLIVSAWNAAVSPHTGRAYSADEVISRFGIPDPAMIKRELPGKAGDEAVEVYHQHYESQHDGVCAFDGVDEMLEALQRCGMPMALVTGKGRRSAGITVRKLGWSDVFRVIVTGEDVEHQKPAPEGLLRVARELKLQPGDCVFVGDSPADMGAGKAAKMRIVAAGWHSHYAEKIRAMHPDAWAEKPADLLELCSIRGTGF
jgi:2-phosphoglycolate phosphatase